jgi:aconitase A
MAVLGYRFLGNRNFEAGSTGSGVALYPRAARFRRSMTEAPPAVIPGARALAILGDSITTDQISPASAIQAVSPGRRETVPLVVRIDTPIEAACFSAGGILPHVLERLLAQPAEP